MTSEIRTNSLKSRAGLSTVTFTDSGPMFSGITTFVDNSGFNIGTGSSIFSPATNTLTLGTNSAERLRIQSNGDVIWNGIGTQLAGEGNNTVGMGFEPRNGTIFLSRAGNATILSNRNNDGRHIHFNQGGTGKFAIGLQKSGADLAFFSGAGNSPTERLRIDSNGKVGVNCTPVGMLEVQKNGVPAIIANYNNSKHLQMGAGGSGAGFHLTTGNFFTINHQPYADRGTDNNLTERLRISSTGLLGVNVNNPLQALHVAGNIINSTSVNSTGDQGIAIGNGHRLGFDQSGTRSWTMKAESGNLTFNSGDGNGAFDFNTTAHLKLPSGTTAQRVNTTGAIRYNNGLGNLEFYDGANWKRIKVLEGPPTTGLLGYWPFSTASRSGSTYNDESGNGQHFTVYGTVNNNTSESKFSGCIDFGTADGNHYLKSSSNSFTDIDASSGFTGVSISVWVRTGNSTQNQWIVSEGTVNTRWAFFNESANAPKWRSTTGYDIIQTGSILDDVWHHLVVTYNHSTRLVQHYRDGSFINQGTVGGQASFTGGYLLVGQHSTLTGNTASYRWRGKMAHMRIYNRVLTAAEVENLYNQW